VGSLVREGGGIVEAFCDGIGDLLGQDKEPSGAAEVGEGVGARTTSCGAHVARKKAAIGAKLTAR